MNRYYSYIFLIIVHDVSSRKLQCLLKKKEGVIMGTESKKVRGKNFDETVSGVTGRIGKAAADISEKTKTIADRSKATVVKVIDANGNGEVDIEDVIIIGLRTPGIHVKRSEFLKKELFKKYPQDVINDAIKYNPAHAKISAEDIDKIADEIIKYERVCVSGISTALGAPGGVAMVATIPADIVQYYGYLLRATQKLLYLYGFPEIDSVEKGQTFDTETINILIICMGVMYGAAGANNALKVMAKGLATGVEKKLLKTALTKGSIYPIVKSVTSWFGIRMTKDIFAGFLKKSIPVVGGVIGGGITFFSFKPCCDRLKASLQNTRLSNPNFLAEDVDIEIICSDEQC